MQIQANESSEEPLCLCSEVIIQFGGRTDARSVVHLPRQSRPTVNTEAPQTGLRLFLGPPVPGRIDPHRQKLEEVFVKGPSYLEALLTFNTRCSNMCLFTGCAASLNDGIFK